MKLYHAPFTCSLFPLIVAHEAKTPVEVIRVDLRTKRTEQGENLGQINPKGKVPALALDEGELITEGPAIAWYLAGCAPGQDLVPEIGSRFFMRLVEALNFLTSDVHKSFGAFFQPTASAEHRAFLRTYLVEQFSHLDGSLRGKRYLLGETFSLADPYLFTMLGWTKFHGIDLSGLSELARFREDVSQRNAVRSACSHERPLENAGAW